MWAWNKHIFIRTFYYNCRQKKLLKTVKSYLKNAHNRNVHNLIFSLKKHVSFPFKLLLFVCSFLSVCLCPTGPPMIRLSVNDTVVVDPGQDVRITCEVTAGFPLPIVTWSRYPGPLPLSAQVRGENLILRAVTPADAGFYNCTAVNNVGNPARKNVNLVVRSK